MTSNDETGEDELLHSVALQNANAILLARQRGERELVQAKERADQLALELKSALRRAMLGADVAKAMTGMGVRFTRFESENDLMLGLGLPRLRTLLH